jgi:hypothetical protein
VGVNLTDGTLFALTGYVEIVFPKLATTAYSVTLKIIAPGYRPATVTIPVPAGSTLPIVTPAIPMRPLPVRLQGRVVKASNRSPMAGASVSSSDTTVLMVRSPLYFDHISGCTVNGFTLNPGGGGLSLAAPIMGGSSTIFLNNNAGLAGQTLQIGADPLAELVTVQTIGPASGQANLQNSLNSTFAKNAPVQLVTFNPAGSTSLNRNSNAGDGLLVVSPGLAPPVIQIVDGAQSEYHLLDAVTDTSGYYHIDGVAGVASLDLSASAGGPAAATTWFLVYNNSINVVDFRL